MHLCFVFNFIFSFTPLVDVLCDHFGVLVLATTWLVPVPVTPCTGRMYDHTIDLAWHCMCVNQINRQLQHCDNSTTKNHHPPALRNVWYTLHEPVNVDPDDNDINNNHDV